MSFSTTLRKAISLASRACEIERRWNFISKNSMDVIISAVNVRIKMFAKENRQPSFHGYLQSSEDDAGIDEEWSIVSPKLSAINVQLEQLLLKAMELQTELHDSIHKSVVAEGFGTVQNTVVIAEMSLIQLSQHIYCFVDGLKMEYCSRYRIFKSLESPLQRDEGLRITSTWSNQPYLKDNLQLLQEFLS